MQNRKFSFHCYFFRLFGKKINYHKGTYSPASRISMSMRVYLKILGKKSILPSATCKACTIWPHPDWWPHLLLFPMLPWSSYQTIFLQEYFRPFPKILFLFEVLFLSFLFLKLLSFLQNPVYMLLPTKTPFTGYLPEPSGIVCCLPPTCAFKVLSPYL